MFGSFGGDLTGNEFIFKDKHLVIDRKIFEGGYGVIYLAKDSDGKNCALKILQVPDKERYIMASNEYKYHYECSLHQNVVSIYGMIENKNENKMIILMEFCEDNLVNQMNKVFGTGFDDKKIVEIFSQICEAVNFIHSCGIIHRDLKPENVLWNEGKWKLCDFGSATNKVYDLANTDEFNEASLDIEKNTTPIYRSPEMCDLYRGQKIDSKSDIWALGCILYKLCTFQDPFPESNLQILNINYKWPESKKINPSFKEIVRCIFKSNPNERPTARELLGKLYSYFPDLIEKKWEIKTQTNTVNFDNPFGLFENVKQTKVIQDKVSSSRSSDFKNPNIGFQFDGEEEKSPEKVDPVDKDMSNRWNFSSFNQDPFANASQNNMKVDPFATASQSNTQIDPFAAASNVDPFANPFGNTSVDPFAATPNVDPFAAAANVKGTPPVDPFANDPFAQK